MSGAVKRTKFHLILIKPTHYDDDGYPITWLRSHIPSNTLAALYGLGEDCRARNVLGPDVDIVIHPIDETNTRVRPDRLLAQTIDEGLRWVAPIGTMMRTATEDTNVNGTPIPKGTAISLIMASANRDEARFIDPDRFDIFRPPLAHMSFGAGAHFCAGKWFAKAQIEIALRTLLDAFPTLAFAGDPPTFRGWEFRAPTHCRIAL